MCPSGTEPLAPGAARPVARVIASPPREAWRNTPKFVAGPSGICFPCNELLVIRPAGRDEPSWLLVPWDDVDNLRLSRSTGDDGSTCVAFDVRLDADQARRYLGRVAHPVDRQGAVAGLAHLAFDDALPSPGRTLQRLAAMRADSRRRRDLIGAT